MVVPITHRSQVIGAITMQSAQPMRFTQADLNALQTIADQLANAISNAHLYEQAQAAQAVAEGANRLKSQFLANMSHELRTPLNAIINFAHLLSIGAEGSLNAGQADLLNRIGDAGRHLLGLINDILDLAKIEAGRMELYREEFALSELLDSVMATAASLVRGKPIELRKELDGALPPVYADRTRIRQVLLNLLSNAVKFSEKGQITLRAWADESWVTVSVQDTGIGIAPEDLSKAFAEFVQLDGDLTRRVGGTGLGLPISKHFVEMHGGEMWATSQAGVGSIFYFTLPRAREQPA
jgi:signal transduction histidine kinase